MNPDYNLKLKIWWRHWSVVLILAILAGLVIWLLVNLGPWLKSWQDNRTARSAQEQLEKAYKNDRYGGATPEETFNLFIGALEKGDTELASRYFVIEKQAAWMKTLATYKNQTLLDNFITELKSFSRDQNMFKFYPSGIWKINDLSIAGIL